MSYSEASSDVSPLAVLDPRLPKRRVVIMDMGHTTMPRIRGSMQLETLRWEDVEEVQEETQAGMMLLCGAPRVRFPISKYFRDWQVSVSSTNGSNMFALLHPKFSEISEGRGAAEEHTIDLAWDRTGLCVQVRRVTARGIPDALILTVLLAKVHLGTKDLSFDVQSRDTFWRNITQRVSTAAQWMVVGALETSENNIRHRWAHSTSNYAVSSSPNNHLRCIASGVDLAAVRFPTFNQQDLYQDQILVLEIADLSSSA